MLKSKKRYLVLAVLASLYQGINISDVQANDTKEHNYYLETVRVVGIAENTLPGNFLRDTVSTGIIGGKTVKELPFTVANLDRHAIDTFSTPRGGVMEALTVVPSVQSTSNNWINSVSIRGFNQNGYSTYVNGIPGAMSSGILPYYWIDSVSVISGPNLGISGTNLSDTIGGSVHMTSKVAKVKPNTDIFLGYKGGSTVEIGVDVGRRLGDDNIYGVRVATNYVKGDLKQPGQAIDEKDFFINLDKKTDDSKTNLMIGYSRIRRDGGSDNFSLATTGLPKIPDTSKSYTPSWLYHTYGDTWIILNHDRKITDSTVGYVNIGYHKFDYYDFYQGSPKITDLNGAFSISAEYWPLGHTRVYFGAGVRGELYTGDVKHEYVVGVDKNWVNRYSGGGDLWTGNGNLYTKNSWDKIQLNPFTPPLQFKQQMTGYHVADTISFADGRAKLMLAIHGHKSSYTKVKNARIDSNATSPTYAFSYQLNPNTVAYISHSESFTAGSVVSGAKYANAGTVLEPTKAKQDEIGVKIEQGDFLHTVSLFKIRKANTIDVQKANGLYRLNDGEQKNTGIEWGFTGKVDEKLDLVGGLMYLNAIQEKTQGAANDGKPVGGTSKITASLGAVYHVNDKLSLIGKLTHNGTASIKNDTIKVPSSTRLDLGASYKTSFGETPVDFDLMIYNVMGADYWLPAAGSDNLRLSEPRMITLSANFQI